MWKVVGFEEPKKKKGKKKRNSYVCQLCFCKNGVYHTFIRKSIFVHSLSCQMLNPLVFFYFHFKTISRTIRGLTSGTLDMDGMEMEDQNQKPGWARGPASQTIKIFLVFWVRRWSPWECDTNSIPFLQKRR